MSNAALQNKEAPPSFNSRLENAFNGRASHPSMASSHSKGPEALFRDGGPQLRRALQQSTLERAAHSSLYATGSQASRARQSQLRPPAGAALFSTLRPQESASQKKDAAQPRLLSSLSRAEKFDVLNPQNNLSKISLQQKLLGNASKVNFSVKPQVRKANLIQMARSKQPAPNKKCNHIKKVLDDFKEELYKQDKIGAGHFEQAHRKNKSMFSTHRSSKVNFMATSMQSSGAESRVPQSFARPGVVSSMLRTEMSIKDRLQMYKSQRPPGPKMEARNAFESGPLRRQAIISRLDQYAQSTLGSQRPSILHALEQEQLSGSIPAGKRKAGRDPQRMRTLQAPAMPESHWKFPSIDDRAADRFAQQSAMNVNDTSDRIRITDQLHQEPERSNRQQQPFDHQIKQQKRKAVAQTLGQQTLPRASPLIATKLLKTMLGAESRNQENSRVARKSFVSEMERMPDRSNGKGSFNSTGPTIVPQPVRDSGDESSPQEKLAQRLSPQSARESQQSRHNLPAQDSFGHDQTSSRPKNLSSEQTFNVVLDPKLMANTNVSFQLSKACLHTKPVLLAQGRSKHALDDKNRKHQANKNAAEDKAFAQFQRLMIKYSDADNESPRPSFPTNAQKKKPRFDAAQRKSGRTKAAAKNPSFSDDSRSDRQRSEQSSQQLNAGPGQGRQPVLDTRAADLQLVTAEPSPLPSTKRESLARLERASPGSARSAGSNSKHQREPRRSKRSNGSGTSAEVKRKKQMGIGEGSKFTPMNEEQIKSIEQRSFLLNTDSNSRRGPSESRLQHLEPTIPRLLRKTGTNDLATPGHRSSDLNGADSPDGRTQIDNRERNQILGMAQTVEAEAGKTEQRSQSRLFPFISSKKHSKQRSMDMNDPFRSTRTRVRHPNTKESSLHFRGNYLSPSSGSVEDIQDILRADAPTKVSLPPASQQRATLPGQDEVEQAQRARQPQIRGGKMHQRNKINPKVLEMKQKERQQMRQNQGAANNEKVFHQSAYSTFKLDLSNPNDYRLKRDGRHSVLGALQYSPILPANPSGLTMVGPAAPQPPWGASAGSSARASFHRQQHIQLQQLTEKHRKKLKATNLQVRGETMHMSSLRDWCKNQQNMYESTRQNGDGDGQTYAGAAAGHGQGPTGAGGHGDYRGANGEPRFDGGMPRHGEYAGSGTLHYSHLENEERSFNVGTYQLNSKSDLHTSRRQLNEIVEIQLRNPPKKDKRDTQTTIAVLQEELNAQSSNEDSSPISPEIKAVQQLRKQASDLDSSPSCNDTAGPRHAESSKRLPAKNQDDEMATPSDPATAELPTKQPPAPARPPRQGSTATFQLDQWERSSLEKKNSLAEHLVSKKSSQDLMRRASSSKVLADGQVAQLHQLHHRNGSNPTIYHPEDLDANQNLQSLFRHLAAHLAHSPLNEYGRFPISDSDLQNTKYFRNFKRQLQIQQQQLERQNLSKIDLKFNGKETQTIEQKRSKHIYELQLKHNLIEPPPQYYGPTSLPKPFAAPAPAQFNDSWRCFEALQPRTLGHDEGADVWSELNNERKPSMKDLTFGEYQPQLGAAVRSPRRGGAFGMHEIQGGSPPVPSFLPYSTRWRPAEETRPVVDPAEHSEGGLTPIPKQYGRRAAHTHRNSKTVVSSSKEPKIRTFGPGGLDHAVQGTLLDYSKSLRSNSHALDSTQNLQSLTHLQSIQKLQDLQSMHSVHSQKGKRGKEQHATHDGRKERVAAEAAQKPNPGNSGREHFTFNQGATLEYQQPSNQKKLLNVVNLQLSVESATDTNRQIANMPLSSAHRQDDPSGRRAPANAKGQGASKKSPTTHDEDQAGKRDADHDVGYVYVARKAPFGNAADPQSQYDLLFQVDGRLQGGAADVFAATFPQAPHDAGSKPTPRMKKHSSHLHPGAQPPSESLIQFTEHSPRSNERGENEEGQALVGEPTAHPDDGAEHRDSKQTNIQSGQEDVVLDPQANRNELVYQTNDASSNLAQTLRRESLPKLLPALVPGDVQVVKSSVASRAPIGSAVQPPNARGGHKRESLTFSPIKNPSLKKGRAPGVDKGRMQQNPLPGAQANQSSQQQRASAASKSPMKKGSRQLDHGSSTRTLRHPSKLSQLTEREEHAGELHYRQAKPASHLHQKASKLSHRHAATGLAGKQPLNQDLPPQPGAPQPTRAALPSKRSSQREPPYVLRNT